MISTRDGISDDRAALPDAAVLDVDLGSERVFPVAEALRGRGAA